MAVQFQKYVVKDHRFPFLKWCDTSQSVQRFGCLENFDGGGGVVRKRFLMYRDSFDNFLTDQIPNRILKFPSYCLDNLKTLVKKTMFHIFFFSRMWKNTII